MKKLVVMLVAFATLGTVGMYANTNASNTVETSYKFDAKVSSFCMAIVKGDLETVKKMIALGEDVNQRERSNGMTPLMYAARYNKVEILELLIENGANTKARCSKGFTALKHAQLSKANATADILIAAKKANKRKA